MTETGKFLWYELMTTDTAVAGEFYSHVIGWKRELVPNENGYPPYTRFLVGDTGVGGMMAIPEEECDRAQPGWIGYIGVDDVDGYAKRVVDAGGSVLREPADIPGILRFAAVADPAGAAFVIFRGKGEPMQRPATGTQGTTGWHELVSGEVESTFAFYSGLFGWTKDQVMDMGGGNIYQLFAAGADAVGAMMKVNADDPVPGWHFYFCVDDIDAAIARIREKQGEILMGPHQVPGDAWIVLGRDPQGARFALVGGRQ
ncbi:MAG: VOC family protein [Parvibaculum sp.]